MKTSSTLPNALHLETFRCGPLDNNLYLLLDREAREAIVVDPSIGGDAAFQRAQKWRDEGIRLAAIWNTHGHFDHVYDNAKWKTEFDVPLVAHPADAPFLEHLREQALWFGLPAPEVVAADHTFHDAQIVSVGSHRATILELPGHSPGSVGFDFGDFILSGDVLFQDSVGRTDLPLCSEADLAASVRRLFELTPQTRVMPGHGPPTSIGVEKRDNLVARDLLRRFP